MMRTAVARTCGTSSTTRTVTSFSDNARSPERNSSHGGGCRHVLRRIDRRNASRTALAPPFDPSEAAVAIAPERGLCQGGGTNAPEHAGGRQEACPDQPWRLESAWRPVL